MTVTGNRPAAAELTGSFAGETALHDKPEESRALVVVRPVAEVAHEPTGSYRPAAFLAHLIATKNQLPQTRERRRAEPGEVIAAYRATEALTGH